MRYKVRTAFNLESEIEDARLLCDSFGGALRRGCFHGLGFGAAAAVLADPVRLPIMCASEDSTDRRLCLEGVFGLLSAESGPAISLCDEFEGDARHECLLARGSQNFGMGRDFDLYTKE